MCSAMQRGRISQYFLFLIGVTRFQAFCGGHYCERSGKRIFGPHPLIAEGQKATHALFVIGLLFEQFIRSGD
jgi:hypothetical protein